MTCNPSPKLGQWAAIALLASSGCIGMPEGVGNDDDSSRAAPQIFLDISLPGGSCSLVSGDSNRTCDGTIALPNGAEVFASVEWGNTDPGFLDVSDNCGGKMEILFGDPFSIKGEWLPPASQSVCRLTARASGKNGGSSELSAIILVQASAPPAAGLPQLSAKLSHSNGTCQASTDQNNVSCDAPIMAGSIVRSSVEVAWGNLTPIQLSVSPTCAGEFLDMSGDTSSFVSIWHATLLNGPCTVTFEAMAEDGTFATAKMHFPVVGGHPEGELHAYVYLEHAGGMCYLNPGQSSSSCGSIAAGGEALVYVEINWGNSSPGTIEVRDTCGGSLSTSFQSSTNQALDWSVPSTAGTCKLLVDAVTSEGETHTFELDVPVN